MKARILMAVMATLAALALVAAGCGGDDGGGGGDGDVATGPGFDGETIRLGVLTPQTGPVAVIGEPLTAGNQVYFDRVNADGGIAGQYQVELVQADTQYEPDRTVQQYNRLKPDVVAFTQVLGTAPTLAIVPQLERDNIVAAPASLDGFWVREPNLLPIGGPYQVQAINALDYYVNEGDGEGKTVCSFIQDDAYGEAGQAGLEFAAERLDVEIANTQRFRVGAQNVTGQIQQLAGANCDMVFLVATPTDAGTILGTAARGDFAPRWIGQSPVWIDELAESELQPYLEQTMWIVAEGTEWGDEEVPGMQQMIQDVEEHRPNQEPDYYFAFGYMQAWAMTELLEQAVENGDLSREGIAEAMTQLGEVDFEGLSGTYTYGAVEERDPPRESTLFEVDPEKPFGLATLEFGYESEFAGQFEFEAQE